MVNDAVMPTMLSGIGTHSLAAEFSYMCDIANDKSDENFVADAKTYNTL